MFSLLTDGSLGGLAQIIQSRLGGMGQSPSVSWKHSNAEADTLSLHFGSLPDPLVAGVGEDNYFLNLQELGSGGAAVNIGGGGFHRVDQASVIVDVEVDVHTVGAAFRAAVMPLVALLGLVHLRISLSFLILGGAAYRDQGGIDDRPMLHSNVVGLEVGVHRLKDLLPRLRFSSMCRNARVVVSSGIRSLISSLPANRRIVDTSLNQRSSMAGSLKSHHCCNRWTLSIVSSG